MSGEEQDNNLLQQKSKPLIKSKGNKLNKNSNNNKDNNNISENEESENEEQTTKNDNSNNKINNDSVENKQNNDTNEKTENKKCKSESEYIAQIEQLENELQLEKYINHQLSSANVDEEVTKLRNELQQKKLTLEHLKKANKKQESALLLLQQQYKKENKKKNNKKKNKKNKNSEENDETEELSNDETVKIVLKIKEKELKNAVKRMNILKEENESLKNLLYEDEDYNNNLILEDKNKQIAEKIQNYIKEKFILNRKLLDHNNCIEEQNLYNLEYENLKSELKQVKKNITESKNKLNILFKNNINANIKNCNTEKNLTEKNANYKSAKLSKKNSLKNTNKTPQKTLLPIIQTNQITSQSILTDDFMQKLKQYLNDDEDEYTILINKIQTIENNRKKLENKHRTEIKQFDSQILSLNEQFKQLSNNSKGTTSNIKVLKFRLNTIKGDSKRQLKKINELKKNLEKEKNISKDKDYEISLLLGQINSLKNIVCLSDITLPQDGISEYVEKIKEEKGLNQDENNSVDENDSDESGEKIIDNRRIKYIKNTDTGIQVDFPEGGAEDENLEETKKNIKNKSK